MTNTPCSVCFWCASYRQPLCCVFPEYAPPTPFPSLPLPSPPFPSHAQTWHKACFRCTECNLALTMKTYKGYSKMPYCNT